MTLLALLMLLATSPPDSASRPRMPTGTVEQLAWMSGCWVALEGANRIEECWMAPGGNLMLGVNRTTRPRGRAAFDFMRIEAGPEGIVYQAQPSGRPATPFRLVESAERRVVFANPEHDFPQRVLYWLDAEKRLHARIEGTIKGKLEGQEWTFERGPADWSKRAD